MHSSHLRSLHIASVSFIHKLVAEALPALFFSRSSVPSGGYNQHHRNHQFTWELSATDIMSGQGTYRTIHAFTGASDAMPPALGYE